MIYPSISTLHGGHFIYIFHALISIARREKSSQESKIATKHVQKQGRAHEATHAQATRHQLFKKGIAHNSQRTGHKIIYAKGPTYLSRENCNTKRQHAAYVHAKQNRHHYHYHVTNLWWIEYDRYKSISSSLGGHKYSDATRM